MSANIQHRFLGVSVLKDGSARWQVYSPVEDDESGTENLGELPVCQALGITSLPFGRTEEGAAEGIVVENIGGRLGFVVGARDTRSAKVVGKLDPGDSVLHTTGPEEIAQVRVQQGKRSASVIVKDADGKHMMLLLDGKNKKAQVLARGAAIEIDENGDISLLGKGGGGIMIQGGKVVINGELKIPGMPPGMQIVCAPIAGPQVLIPVTSVPPAPSAGTLVPGTWSPLMNVSGFTAFALVLAAALRAWAWFA
jgi:hypothetical protein